MGCGWSSSSLPAGAPESGAAGPLFTPVEETGTWESESDDSGATCPLLTPVEEIGTSESDASESETTSSFPFPFPFPLPLPFSFPFPLPTAISGAESEESESPPPFTNPFPFPFPFPVPLPTPGIAGPESGFAMQKKYHNGHHVAGEGGKGDRPFAPPQPGPTARRLLSSPSGPQGPSRCGGTSSSLSPGPMPEFCPATPGTGAPTWQNGSGRGGCPKHSQGGSCATKLS